MTRILLPLVVAAVPVVWILALFRRPPSDDAYGCMELMRMIDNIDRKRSDD